MNSKPLKKNISFKTIFTVFGISAAVLLGIRLYQLFCLNERDGSGFFDHINASVYIFYIASAVFAAVIIALVSLTDKVPASKMPRGKSKPLAIASFVMTAGLAYDTGYSFSLFIKAVMTYGASGDLGTYLFSNGMFSILFEGVFGLAACIYFTLLALSYHDGKNSFREYKLLALTPLFWAMFKTVYRFMTKISFIVVADLMLELAELVFAMLFLLSFARINSQIVQKYEMRKAMKYGFATALFACVIGLSRFVITICGLSECLPNAFSFSLVDPALAVFTLVYIDTCSKTGRSAEEDELILTEEESDNQAIDNDFLDN